MGITYSLLPLAAWKKIGLRPQRAVQCQLADGTVVERRVSECEIHLPQGRTHTPVFLGEEGGDQPLLGAVTLENLGLVLNPFARTLQPMQMILA